MNEAPKNSSEPKQIVPGFELSSSQAGGQTDPKATLEANAFAARNLEEISKQREHTRSERFRDHIATAAVCVVWLVFGLFIIAAGCLACHYLLPKKCLWLDEDQLTTLKTFVFSGAITSGASSYFARRI